MKPRVFIHSNHRQLIGALVSQHSLRRYSRNAERFDVEILHTEDHPFLREPEGELYLREGEAVPWHYDDLQSFTPLRFMPPERMGYEGRALVIDPDVFAVALREAREELSKVMEVYEVMCGVVFKREEGRQMIR